MVSQLQILNKVLQNKDFSLISMNNLTSEHFFQYQNEFNFIKNHYEKLILDTINKITKYEIKEINYKIKEIY